MKLIKSATAYKCELPSALAMDLTLRDNKFVELGEQEFSRAGFVDSEIGTGYMVRNFPGGFAFSLRYDEKILPAASVKAEVEKRIKDQGLVNLDKKEKAVIKDQVYWDLLKVALVKTTEITCFYLPEKQLLIVPTTSKKLADVVTGKLVRSIGSIKATTLHIDGIKQSLTGKLTEYLQAIKSDEPTDIGGFLVGYSCKLKGDDSNNAATFKFLYPTQVADGLLEAITGSEKVTELELRDDQISFRLNSEFSFKGIRFLTDADEEEIDSWESGEDEWKYHAATQTIFFSNAIDKLLKLFEYKDEVK